MADRPTYRPVYKALHRPLTIWGVDRRLFFLSLLLGAATFNLFYSFLAGLLMFGGLYGFALWATARDPEMLRILLASSRARRRYDAAKHDRIELEVAPGPHAIRVSAEGWSTFDRALVIEAGTRARVDASCGLLLRNPA